MKSKITTNILKGIKQMSESTEVSNKLRAMISDVDTLISNKHKEITNKLKPILTFIKENDIDVKVKVISNDASIIKKYGLPVGKITNIDVDYFYIDGCKEHLEFYNILDIEFFENSGYAYAFIKIEVSE